MALITDRGWSDGDDVRVLVAAGLSVSVYTTRQIQSDMNYMLDNLPGAVGPIIELLDAYDVAENRMSSLNETSDGKILTKADVLEWAATSPGLSYSPERELNRIRGLLYQYFGSSILFSGGLQGGISGTTSLVRS